MFWKFDHRSASSSDSNMVLDQGVSLYEVMDNEDIIERCRVQNKRLTDYLTKPDVMEELVTLITAEPSNRMDERVRYKYSNIACELLTSDVPAISECLVNNHSLLERLYVFLESDAPLNPLSASFFSRIFGNLLTCRTQQVLEFLMNKEDFVTLLLKHLGTASIMDLMLKLMVIHAEMEETQLLSWLNRQHVVLQLMGLLDPSVDSERHHNASQLLCTVIKTLRIYEQPNSDMMDHDPVLDTLRSSQAISQLLEHILGPGRCETSIVGGMTVLLALLGVSMDSNGNSKNMYSSIIPRLQDFHNLLLHPPHRPSVKTTIGILDPPLGKVRLQVATLIAVLLASNNGDINEELAFLGTMEVLLDLFFIYPWNNFLHTQVKLCIISALNSELSLSAIDQKRENTLLKNIFIECGLLQKIVEVWNENEKLKQGNLRKGYFGHVTTIANHIVQQTRNGHLEEFLKKYVAADVMISWENFVSGTLANINKVQEVKGVAEVIESHIENANTYTEGASTTEVSNDLAVLLSGIGDMHTSQVTSEWELSQVDSHFIDSTPCSSTSLFPQDTKFKVLMDTFDSSVISEEVSYPEDEALKEVGNNNQINESDVLELEGTFYVPEETPFIVSDIFPRAKHADSCLSSQTDVNDTGKRGMIHALFPWFPLFGNLCRAALGSRSIKCLELLLNVYLRNVTKNVQDCYMKPCRAAKLKKCMNEALVFFHLLYQDIQEPGEHHYYLELMTDLVSMYIDMEIKASRCRRESLKKVACRLVSSLYIFLDNSEDHILDAILKAKLVNKHNGDVCTPVLRKILNNVRTPPLYEIMYVRCLLVFKIWKKIVTNSEERKRINKIAVQKLSPSPNFTEKSNIFSCVLPRIPKSSNNVTLFLMLAKFSIKNACTAFLKKCKDSQGSGMSETALVNLEKPVTFSDRLMMLVTPALNSRCNNNVSNRSRLKNDLRPSTSSMNFMWTSRMQDSASGNSKVDKAAGKKNAKEKAKKKVKLKDEPAKDKTKCTKKGKEKKLKRKAVPALTDSISDIIMFMKLDDVEYTEYTKNKQRKLEWNESKPSVNISFLLKTNGAQDLASQSTSEPAPGFKLQSNAKDLFETDSQINFKCNSQNMSFEKVTENTDKISVEEETTIKVERETFVDNVQSVNSEDQREICEINGNPIEPKNSGEVNENCEEQDKCTETIRLDQTNTSNPDDIKDAERPDRTTVITKSINSEKYSVLENMSDGENTESLTKANDCIEDGTSKLSCELMTSSANVDDAVLQDKHFEHHNSLSHTVTFSEIASDSIVIPEESFMSIVSGTIPSTSMSTDIENKLDVKNEPLGVLDQDVKKKIGLKNPKEMITEDSFKDTNASESSNTALSGGEVDAGIVNTAEESSQLMQIGEQSSESTKSDTINVCETPPSTNKSGNALNSEACNIEKHNPELPPDSHLIPTTLPNIATDNSCMEAGCEEATRDQELESLYEVNNSCNNYICNDWSCVEHRNVGFSRAVPSNSYMNVETDEDDTSENISTDMAKNERRLNVLSPSESSCTEQPSISQVSACDKSAADLSRTIPKQRVLDSRTSTFSSMGSEWTTGMTNYYTKMLDHPFTNESMQSQTGRSLEELHLGRVPPLRKNTVSNFAEGRQLSENVVPTMFDPVNMNQRSIIQRTHLNPTPTTNNVSGILDTYDTSGHWDKESINPPLQSVFLQRNSVYDKLGPTYSYNLHQTAPLSTSNIPPSVPCPAITPPTAVGQLPFIIHSSCCECYASHILYMQNRNIPAQSEVKYANVPVQFCNFDVGYAKKLQSAEEKQSEDEELLKRIEESLAETKVHNEADHLDRKSEMHSSLPLKKRLKSYTHISETKTVHKPVSSTETDRFPSYSSTRMISIAELDFTRHLQETHQDIT